MSQEMMILPNTPKLIDRAPSVSPVPTMAPVAACVVLTGIPSKEAIATVVPTEKSTLNGIVNLSRIGPIFYLGPVT